MSQTTSYQVADSLFLTAQEVGQKKVEAKPVEVPTNYITVIDCSGSMTNDLPKIKDQLKKKLPKLLKEKDTFSIIWFSGRNQCGILVEGEPVATLADLADVNAAIDRWLRPVGMTGFKEPLELVPGLVAKLSKKYPGNFNALMFLSDGCDNQWPRGDVIKAVEKASAGLASTTIFEYGYYADRPLLTAMAEKAGGSLLFAQDFDSYAPNFEAVVQRRQTGGKRIEVPIKGDPVGGFVFAMAEGDLTTYAVESGKVAVPESTSKIWFLNPTSGDSKGDTLAALAKAAAGGSTGGPALDAAYAAVSLFSVRMKPDVVYPLLKSLGDVKYIESFGGCFGKQKYSEFMDSAKAAAFGTGRFEKGYDPKKLPKDDAFTVLDMLRLLASDDDNRVMLDHPSFKYSRISRARVDAGTVLTAEEQAEVERLTDEMMKVKKDAKKVAEFSAKIAAISNKPAPLKFEADPAPDGYSVSNLTYNEKHPNVSIQVRKTGTVDISSRLPAEFKGKVPEKFPTFIFRNYAIVKDGLVNVEVIPAKLSAPTLAKLFELHKAEMFGDDVIKADGDLMLINFKSLPVINRKMVKAASAKTLFEKEWALLKVQAEQKVYKAIAKEKFGGKTSAGFEEQYGKAAADWLKEQGFTDYSGFGPKGAQAESTDVYRAKKMDVSVKGFSSIPSLNEFKKMATKGKFTPSGQLMSGAVAEIDKYAASDAFKAGGDAGFEKWLREKDKALDRTRRDLLTDKAQQIFSTVVGQVWFTEFASLDENSMTMTLDGQKLDCKVEMSEVEIKI